MSEQKEELTSVSAWKSGANDGLKPTELPSGKWAKIRKVSLQTMMQTGQLPNALMGPVKQALGSKDKELDQEELSKVMADPKALMDMFALVDDITVRAFVEPKLQPLPFQRDNQGKVVTDQAGQPIPIERDPNLLYVDEVDLDDKMFIFHWMVGGSSDLNQFREQSAANVAAIPGGSDMASASQPDGGHYR